MALLPNPFAGFPNIYCPYADLYSTVFDMLIGPMFFVGLAATVVGCVVGAFLGKLLLKKHFQKAGIV